eukprot:UN05115
MSTLKVSFNTFRNFSEDVVYRKKFQILICKTLKNFYLGKSALFTNFPNHRISFVFKSTGVDQVLTQIFQIDPKLILLFSYLNHDHISKIEEI